MNDALVAIGFLGLLGGASLILLFYPTMSEYESMDGELAGVSEENTEKEYVRAVGAVGGGSCCGVIGAVLLVMAAYMERKAKKRRLQEPYEDEYYPDTPSDQPPPNLPSPLPAPMPPCPDCGQMIDSHRNECPDCSKDLDEG